MALNLSDAKLWLILLFLAFILFQVVFYSSNDVNDDNFEAKIREEEFCEVNERVQDLKETIVKLEMENKGLINENREIMENCDASLI